jgi:hypothetical protein
LTDADDEDAEEEDEEEEEDEDDGAGAAASLTTASRDSAALRASDTAAFFAWRSASPRLLSRPSAKPVPSERKSWSRRCTTTVHFQRSECSCARASYACRTPSKQAILQDQPLKPKRWLARAMPWLDCSSCSSSFHLKWLAWKTIKGLGGD